MPGHPLSGTTSISRKEFARLTLIGVEEAIGTGRLLRDYFAGMAMPDISMRVGSIEAVKRAVESGPGVSPVLACADEQAVRGGRAVGSWKSRCAWYGVTIFRSTSHWSAISPRRQSRPSR